MTEICRILTENDVTLVPAYLEIFKERLDEIEGIYPPGIIDEARLKYTPEYVVSHLRPNEEVRFVGHFSDDTLDGILIEGFDEFESGGSTIRRALIKWTMAHQSGKGIGGALVRDCIERAKEESRDGVSLVVSQKNPAKRLYERLGFQIDPSYNEAGMLLMHYFTGE